MLPLLLAGCTESTRQAAVDDTVLPKYAANPQVKAVASSLIRHDYANGEVASLCKAGLDRLQASIGGEVKDVLALDRILADVSDELSPLTFMGYVNVKPELRAEASSCEESYSKAMVDVFTRRELYKAVLATDAKDAGQKRLVSEFKRQFEANGMALPDDKLQQLKALKSELAELETKFQKNLNEDTSSVEFTAAELEGASPEFLKRLRRGKNGRYIVTTKSTDYTQLMDNVRVPDTRRRMLTAYDNRAPDNTALLERAVVLRQQIAQMVGYPTWADYQTNGRMAANAANVQKMLGDLKAKLRPRLRGGSGHPPQGQAGDGRSQGHAHRRLGCALFRKPGEEARLRSRFGSHPRVFPEGSGDGWHVRDLLDVAGRALRAGTGCFGVVAGRDPVCHPRSFR